MNLGLIYSLKKIFDRVFQSDDIYPLVVEFAQQGIKSGAFTGTGWSGYQQFAKRLLNIF